MAGWLDGRFGGGGRCCEVMRCGELVGTGVEKEVLSYMCK